ncbi:MAG: DUF1573 domain-containing protein [Planctomycetota bacterium]
MNRSSTRLLSLALLAATQVGVQPAAQAPALTLVDGTEAIHDFGEVEQGERLLYDFELVSSGSEPVILTKIKPSCGCLLASVERWDPLSKRYLPYVLGMPLRPEHKIRLRAVMTTDGRAGVLKTQINLRTNAANPDLSLALNAKVRPILEVAPHAFLDLGNQPSSEDLAASFVVSAPRLGVFDLELDRGGLPPNVAVALVPLGAMTEGMAPRWRVDVRLAGPHAEGRRTWMIRVKTNARLPLVSTRNFERHFTIQANVKGQVSVQPEYARFGMIEAGARPKLVSTITVHDGQRLQGPIEVLLIPSAKSTELDYEQVFRAAAEIAEDGLSARVSIELVHLPPDFIGSLSGIAQVPIGHPERPVVQIHFSALIRDDL